MSAQNAERPPDTEPRDTERLGGIPYAVNETRKAFCILTLKAAGIELNGQVLKNIIVTHESRFITWVMANDAHRMPGACPRSLEYWRRYRPQSYRTLSHLILRVNSLLDRIYELLNERLGPDQKSVLDLFLRHLRGTLKSLEDVTDER
ncbi:hypothetical protein B0J15DRAFT_547872 [Fusarium solani]|uniref:Uncharacterized protein n=1 Tax=Fusarium solani TaxID=169388 RepID=A0A9P9KN69_FUSSL|nr:uncharacterized protein B0J15DRAFT_547872 [Fusarium solani]KAH7260264.1 hypothetical protein B0J15DRAFT_547872 [Fusarium solani]